MNTEDNIIRASGLNRNSNDIVLPPGSLVAGDECVITKDNVISRRRGFYLCNTGLPAAKPEQLFVSNGKLYVHINNQLWYQASPCVYENTPSSAVTFDQPYGLWGDSNELYVTSLDHTVRKIIFTNPPVVSLVAGQPGTPGSANGTGSAATFNNPRGIWGDSTNLYICDSSNHTIRQIVRATGVVTTLAGQAGIPGYTDAAGVLAQFDFPWGLVGDGAGNLYICDSNNNVIRKIVIVGANVTTYTGTGVQGNTDGGPGVAEFDNPVGISYNSSVPEFRVVQQAYNNMRVINAAVDTSTVSPIWSNQDNNSSIIVKDNKYYVSCGSLGVNFYAILADFVEIYGNTGYRDGDSDNALLDGPNGLWNIGDYIYVADTGNQVIRRLNINTLVTETYVGTPGVSGSQDSAFLPPLEGPT